MTSALLTESDHLITGRELSCDRFEEESVGEFLASLERKRKWPNAARLKVAWQLALDLETCAALLRGEPVDPSRLDQTELAKAREETLVQFVAPIDALGDIAA
jgi:hypothetical protein